MKSSKMAFGLLSKRRFNQFSAATALLGATLAALSACAPPKGGSHGGIKMLSESERFQQAMTGFATSPSGPFDIKNAANMELAGHIEGASAIVTPGTGDNAKAFQVRVSFLVKGEASEFAASAYMAVNTFTTLAPEASPTPAQGSTPQAASSPIYRIEARCYTANCSTVITRLFFMGDGNAKPETRPQTVVLFSTPAAIAAAQSKTPRLGGRGARIQSAQSGVVAADDVTAKMTEAATAAATGPVSLVIRNAAGPTGEMSGGVRLSVEDALVNRKSNPAAAGSSGGVVDTRAPNPAESQGPAGAAPGEAGSATAGMVSGANGTSDKYGPSGPAVVSGAAGAVNSAPTSSGAPASGANPAPGNPPGAAPSNEPVPQPGAGTPAASIEVPPTNVPAPSPGTP